MAISDKLTYLNTTKSLIRDGINAIGGELTSSDTFRSYVNALNNIYDYLPKITGTGTSITLNDTAKGKMILNLGSSELSQDGTPTPSSPQDIHTISGSNTIKVEGKNKYNATLSSTSFYGITYSADNSKVYANGTSNAEARILFHTQTLSAGTYSLNIGNLKGTYQTLKVYLYDGTSWTTFVRLNNVLGNISASFTLSEDKDITLGIYQETTSSYTNFSFEYQITSGSTADYNFEPYVSQEANIDLGDLEYCKIGNYEDKFIRSNDGTWQLEKNIGKVVLDGSENWSVQGSTTDYYEYRVNNGVEIAGTNSANDIKTNYFNQTTNSRVVINGAKTIYLRFPTSSGIDVSTLELFKTWLSTHNLEVYYSLATPTYTPITGTLAEQLENVYQKLKSYAGATNISQTNTDLPFVINASALQDLSTL